MITPHTYSHIYSSLVNYLNYKNNAQNTGPSLEPDSCRLEISTLIRPDSFVGVARFFRFMRHGNSPEERSGGADGSMFDPGRVGGVPIFTPSGGYPNTPGGLWTRFLMQSVIEKTLQAVVDTSLNVDTHCERRHYLAE